MQGKEEGGLPGVTLTECPLMPWPALSAEWDSLGLCGCMNLGLHSVSNP